MTNDITFREAHRRLTHILHNGDFDDADIKAIEKALWALSFAEVEEALYKILIKGEKSHESESG